MAGNSGTLDLGSGAWELKPRFHICTINYLDNCTSAVISYRTNQLIVDTAPPKNR